MHTFYVVIAGGAPCSVPSVAERAVRPAVKDMGKGGIWRLDNAMIAASAETMRGFLRHLRRVLMTSTSR